MPTFLFSRPSVHRLAGVVTILAASILMIPASHWSTQTDPQLLVTEIHSSGSSQWHYPVRIPAKFGRMFVQPASDYGAGHRGIDFQTASASTITAPVSGMIFFSGTVADKPVLTLQVDESTLVSFEPIDTTLVEGERVARGEVLGTTAVGGHCAAQCIHMGVRVDGIYVNPLRFLAVKPYLLPLKSQ